MAISVQFFIKYPWIIEERTGFPEFIHGCLDQLDVMDLDKELLSSSAFSNW